MNYNIEVPNDSIRRKIQEDFDLLIKPVGSLAKLEDITCQYAAIKNINTIDYPSKKTIIFAGDKNSSLFFANTKNKKNAIGVLANRFGSEIFLVDITEVTSTECDIEKLLDFGKRSVCDIISKTDVFSVGYYDEFFQDDYQAFFNRFSTVAKTEKQSIELEKINSETCILKAANILGRKELIILAGAYLALAERSVPILLDGEATCLAAFIASKIEPKIINYFIAVSSTKEPDMELILTELGLSTMLDAKLKNPSGEGAVLGFDLLNAGIKALREMDSFGAETVHFPLGDIK